MVLPWAQLMVPDVKYPHEKCLPALLHMLLILTLFQATTLSIGVWHGVFPNNVDIAMRKMDDNGSDSVCTHASS